MTEFKTDYGALEEQRQAWERLENNHKRVLAIPWEEFDNTKNARIPKALDLVHILHSDIFEYPYLSVKTSEGKLRIKRPSLYTNNGLTAIPLFYGTIKTKNKKSDKEETEISYIDEVENVPNFVNAIIDYLHGTISFQNDEAFLVNQTQFIRLTDLALAERYKTGARSVFNSAELQKLLKFIHNHLQLKPVKIIQKHVVATDDFQIDLQKRKVKQSAPPQKNECYFKYFEGQNYANISQLSTLYAEFLSNVTDDPDSLQNASLQPVYQMLVACGLIPKMNFFVSKSAERTGKGFRNGIIASLFDTKTINLNELSNKATGAMAWANLDSKEMYLATESAGLDRELEIILKIIATETVAQGRKQGHDYSDVNLSGVLSIDTNEKVLFSSGMKSRAVNIAFKNRPIEETDEERKEWFKPYIEQLGADKIAAGLAALIHSFVIWKSHNFKLNFKDVEMNNFAGEDAQFDDVQSYVIDAMIQGQEIVIITGNEQLKELLKETYTGGNKKKDRLEAFKAIGVGERNYRVISPKNPEQKILRHIKKVNSQRFQKASTAFMEQIMNDSGYINNT